jgi:hypothetical protein
MRDFLRRCPLDKLKSAPPCCREESEQKKMNTSDLFAAHLVFLLPLTQTGIEY